MCRMRVYIQHCTGGMLQPLKEEACSAWTFFYTLALLIAQKKNPQVFTFEKNPFVCKQMHTLLKKHCACGTGSLVFLTEDCFLERSVH